MHQLNRNTVAIPPCLAPTDPPRRYAELRRHEIGQVRTALLEIQKDRCAYCERRTGQENDDGHIEHFRNQAAHAHLETEWSNLFWSCMDERSCGKHKDKCNIVGGSGTCRAFVIADIINPGTDNPEYFIQFVSDGTIVQRSGLDANEQRRFEETMRVFQLRDSALLRKSRADAVKPYIGALNALRESGAAIFRDYIAGECARLDSVPFATAIGDFLKSNL